MVRAGDRRIVPVPRRREPRARPRRAHPLAALHPPRRDDRRGGRGGDGRHIFRISRKLHLLRHPALHRAVERAGAAVPAAALAAGDGERGARAGGAAPRRRDAFAAPTLAWLGLGSAVPITNDYVPVFPWFGMVLAGVAATQALLPAIRRLARWRADAGLGRALVWAGRRSLAIYLVHQPILLGVLYPVALLFPPGPTAQAAPFLRQCERSCTSAGRSAPAARAPAPAPPTSSSGATSGRVPCATSSPRPSARPPARSPEGASSPSRSDFSGSCFSGRARTARRATPARRRPGRGRSRAGRG